VCSRRNTIPKYSAIDCAGWVQVDDCHQSPLAGERTPIIGEQIRVFSAFTKCLQPLVPLSARVDLLLHLTGHKPCIRTTIVKERNEEDLREWCERFGYEYQIDSEDYLYIGRSTDLLDRAIELDHSVQPHAQNFGQLLGYPSCCCQRIATVGEDQIDAYEERLVAKGFADPFVFISPLRYRAGSAFISHVPCSTTCRPSLLQAISAVKFVLANQNAPVMGPWIEALQSISQGLIPCPT
jgi:hypothetical protein